METLEEKVARVVKEEVAVLPYDALWPESFERERLHLLTCLPPELVRRIEHFGSTAVPGLSAKPIVDILVEVTSLEETRKRIAPIPEAQGYDYFWRPSWGEDAPPYYAWFIKRDGMGRRTHHILIENPLLAKEYEGLKTRLSEAHRGDRAAYTKAKTDFIVAVTEKAKEHNGGMRSPGRHGARD